MSYVSIEIELLHKSTSCLSNGLFKVERDVFCREVLAARMREGCLEAAELHEDVRQYHPTGAARLARVLMGGWPCQA